MLLFATGCFAAGTAAPVPTPAAPASPLAQLALSTEWNIDAVGGSKGSLFPESAWSAPAARLAIDFVLPDVKTNADATVFRSATHRKAPKRIDIPLGQSAEYVHLVTTYEGDVPRNGQVLRVSFAYADGATAYADLKANEGIFPLSKPGSSGWAQMVPVGGSQALSLTTVGNPHPERLVTSLGIESRTNTASVYLFAASAGPALGSNPPPVRDAALTGFTFPLGLSSPAPPVPEAWTIEPVAGSRGKVQVKDGHYAFADGTRAKFWGVNLLQESCAPPKELAPRLARQLADYGFNMVRMHHCDTTRAGLIKADRKAGESPFDPAGLDRFDFLLAEFAKVGIYVWLEVATNRAFTEADGVAGAGPEIPNGHKLVSVFQPDWRRAYLDWTKAWLGRTNPYTKQRLADDPAIAVVEMANEHSLLVNFFSGGIERLPERHRVALDEKWAAFVHQRYADEAALTAAWSGSINPGLRPDESFARPSRRPFNQGTFAQWPERRALDLYDFYKAFDEDFYAEVAGEVKQLGFTVPLLAGITYGTPAVAEMMAKYDGIDVHVEWDKSGDGTLRNDSIIRSPRANFIPDRWRDPQEGKPFSISELNHGHPNEHQAEAPLFWAAMASIQDWDALIWLNYTNGEIVEEATAVGGGTELRSAVLKWSQMPTASGLFRSGAIAPAPGLFVLGNTPTEVRDAATALDRPTVPQLRDVRFLLANRVRSDFASTPTATRAGSPGDQVGWWVDASRFVVDTPVFNSVLGDHALRFRAGTGEGAGPTAARALDPQLNGEAAVSLTCTTGASLDKCTRALLAVAGVMQNAGAVTTGGGSTVLEAGDGLPVLARPEGAIRFAWPRKPTVKPIFSDGTLGDPVETRLSSSGWWSLSLDTAGPTVWWEISG